LIIDASTRRQRTPRVGGQTQVSSDFLDRRQVDAVDEYR